MKSDSVKMHLKTALLGVLFAIAAAGLGWRSIHSPIAWAAQDAASEPRVLTVAGAGPAPITLTADDLAKMPRATAALTSDGTTVTYEGVLLYDILAKAGWQFGHGMAGKGMASYLIATGKDGYQVVFALPEIDPQFSGQKVIVADKADGAPLPGRQQPFRIIAPQDKMRARSIYSLVKLEIVRLHQ